jgi:hypothetical protein
LKSKGVKRLEFIFLTHPDIDHFLGMADVITHFTVEDRSIGFFCDSGVNAQQVKAILEEGLGKAEYTRLQKTLDDLDASNAITFYEINDQHEPISPKGFGNEIQLFPIAPSAGMKRRVVRSGIIKYRSNKEAKQEANALSIILILSIKHDNDHFTAALAADAGRDEIESSLEIWEQRAREKDRMLPFDVIKVPHHGSIKSHTERLCTSETPGACKVAAVCGGVLGTPLPDRFVLQDYLNKGWNVVLTARRRALAATDSPASVICRTKAPRADLELTDIELSWNKDHGLRCIPHEAAIDDSELNLYETAKSL